MDLQSLLSLLSDGEYHSGSELGDKLGVSRTAIWKSLGRLADYNLEVESVKGKGYRLPNALNLLSAGSISAHLPSDIRDRIELSVNQSLESTNRYVSEKMPQKSSEFFVATSEMQTDGRGRRGRAWQSPFAKNVYLSIGFDLDGGVEILGGLSLVIGIASVKALKSCCPELAVGLKWPNDLWIEDKKVGGILVELQGEATSGWRVVVGVGINVSMDESDVLEEIDQPWVSIGRYDSCERNRLVSALIEQIVRILDEYRVNGFDAFIERWELYDCLHGREVAAMNGAVEGKACGVDQTGALLVKTAEGVKAVSAGELSVRPK